MWMEQNCPFGKTLRYPRTYLFCALFLPRNQYYSGNQKNLNLYLKNSDFPDEAPFQTVIKIACPQLSFPLPFLSMNLVQFSSVAQLCPTLCDPMSHSTPGLLVHHQLLEFTQTHVHRVSDAIQPSHPLSSPSPRAPNPSQHQSLFQWVNSSHEVTKILEFQL